MKNKLGISIMTTLSAVLFCILIIVTSLSPLSDLGNATNQFNSVGMWLGIAMILILYAIPILLYLIGLEWMKYMMAFLCAMGIFIFTSMLFIIIMLGIIMGIISANSIVIVTCILANVVNIIWFFVAFKVTSRKSAIITGHV